MKDNKGRYEDLIYEALREEVLEGKREGLRFKELWERLKGKMAIATLSKTLKKLEIEGKITRIPVRGKKEVRYVLTDEKWICSAFIALRMYKDAVKFTKEIGKETQRIGLDPVMCGYGLILSHFRTFCRYFKNDPVKAFDIWDKLFDILYSEFHTYPLKNEGELMRNVEEFINECKNKTITDLKEELKRVKEELSEILVKE